MFGWTVVLWLPITFCGLAKVAIITTKLHTKNRTTIIRKIVIRSTEPPLLQARCYRFVLLVPRSGVVSSQEETLSEAIYIQSDVCPITHRALAKKIKHRRVGEKK